LKPKKIFLVRHGQTDFNLNGIVQGRGVDSVINQTGRLQAQKFYETYKDVPFEKVYVSALKRTIQTMEPFLGKGIPIEKREGLDEIDWGIREKEKISNEENAYYQSLVSSWSLGGTDRKIEGGECPEDVRERLLPIIEEWKQGAEENLLVCTHGRTLRILLSVLLNYPLSKMDVFQHHNLSLYKMIYTGSFFHIGLFNDLSHLR
jgi:2,3-bisphosphoglycerate-dependent phosphoglycerate mutase